MHAFNVRPIDVWVSRKERKVTVTMFWCVFAERRLTHLLKFSKGGVWNVTNLVCSCGSARCPPSEPELTVRWMFSRRQIGTSRWENTHLLSVAVEMMGKNKTKTKPRNQFSPDSSLSSGVYSGKPLWCRSDPLADSYRRTGHMEEHVSNLPLRSKRSSPEREASSDQICRCLNSGDGLLRAARR